MGNCIPRLVIHNGEIVKIIECSSRFEQPNTDDSDDSDESSIGSLQVEIDSIGESTSTDDDEEFYALCERIVSFVNDTPTKFQEAVKASVLQRLQNLKSCWTDESRPDRLPSTIDDQNLQDQTTATWIIATAKKIDRILTKIVSDVSKIPGNSRRASLIVFSFPTVSSLFQILMLALRLRPVDDGPTENRVFSYCMIPISILVLVSTFVASSNCAMPQMNFSALKNLFTTLLCTSIGVGIYFLSCLGFAKNPIFPLPFSFLVSGMPATMLITPVLYLLTSKADREKGKFRCLWLLHGYYWGTLALAVFWATGVTRLNRNVVAFPVIMLLPLLRFVCKILLCAPLAHALNPERAYHLIHMVDVIVTTVSCATYPFIDSWVKMLWLLLASVGTILWRLYCGVDRLRLLWGRLNCPNDEIPLRKRLSSISECLSSPSPKIHEMSKELSKSTMKTEMTFDDDSSQYFNDEETGGSVVLSITKQSKSSTDVPTGSAEPNNDHQVGLTKAQVQDIFRDRIDASDSPQTTKDQSQDEEQFENRFLYHVAENLVTLKVDIVLRTNLCISTLLVRNLPTKDHLNSSFEIDDEQWGSALTWGYVSIALSILVFILSMAEAQRNFKNFFQVKGINIRGVLLYTLGQHYWNYLMWTLLGSMFFISVMINHFGFDFTLNFVYLKCLGNTEFPICPSV
jgi:hypothetical protein